MHLKLQSLGESVFHFANVQGLKHGGKRKRKVGLRACEGVWRVAHNIYSSHERNNKLKEKIKSRGRRTCSVQGINVPPMWFHSMVLFSPTCDLHSPPFLSHITLFPYPFLWDPPTMCPFIPFLFIHAPPFFQPSILYTYLYIHACMISINFNLNF